MPLDPITTPLQTRNDSISQRSDSPELQTKEHSGCNVLKPDLSTYPSHIDLINNIHRGIPYSSELRTEVHFGCSVTPYIHNILRTVDFSQVDLRDWVIVDSGATSNFLVTETPVAIPNGSRVQSTHDYKLAIPELSEKARIGHIIPGLASHSLVSVIKLCNAGCEVTFTKIECIVVVLAGYKCQRTGLWMIPLTSNMETYIPTDHTVQHMWHQ